MKRNSTANAVIRHHLQRGVVNQYRKIDLYLCAPSAARCDDSRTNKNGCDTRVFSRLPAKSVHIFVFAGNLKLQSENRVAFSDEIITWAATPLSRSRNDAFVTHRKLFATNSVVETGVEGQIGTVIWSLAHLIYYRSGMLRGGRYA